MLSYISRRFVYMLISMMLLSFVSFLIIELPPGDFAEMTVRSLEVSGTRVDEGLIDQLKERYGYDKPFMERYVTWITDILARQDFGIAMLWNKPVSELITDRLPFTILLSVATLVFTYAVAIPIGIFSATRQYSLGDYFFSFFGFIGVAVPDFLLALVLMYILLVNFGISPGGLFSPEFETAPWSLAKIWDLSKHLIVPIVITGMAGTAVLIRTMRATLLDELSKDYVDTARMKGVPYWRAIWKYPVRIAINPLLSTIGWLLPAIVSGSTIVAIVLNLPTVGPLLISALLAQDMFLAGGIIFILSLLTLVGTFLSDMILALADPRIRYD
ncbi:MAG: ABC transporter permease [Anaerolineae bacterium]|nr:ABC transporter permease [Anaerolineae bacterium]